MEDKSPTVQLAWLKARVEKLLADRNLTTKWLYDRIPMTKTGYRQMWERDTIRYVTLEAIARSLQVPVADLITGNPTAITVSEPQPTYGKRYLEDRVDELERRMAEMEKRK
jgi:DNA-binding Xre family transcriptional regulator